MEAHGAVTIQVSPPPVGSAPTYAVVYTDDNGERESAGFQQVRPDGLTSFSLIADHSYTIGAFTDENRNSHYDAGEPGALVSGVHPVRLNDPTMHLRVWPLNLKREHGLPAGTVIEVPKENKALGGQLNVALGDVVSLDDKRFAADVGGGGLWRPFDFLSANTIGIYFAEPYDPNRIPVLFVYGIGGSPQDMRYLMEHFDKKRYQCWFFHYPSGARLDRVAEVLAAKLRILKKRHGFSRCYVVAHSMGGLVAYTAVNYTVRWEGSNFIPAFVSISTPWGGHNAASAGIRRLRKPVPSWLDVAPNSDFLNAIYATPLPKGTRFSIIYGSKEGGPFWLKGENDGVVTVESETDPRVKDEAASVTHLKLEHVAILKNDETLAKVQQLLRQ
jgi:pimeloyl-ACP methyl ester carboxylesterase